MGRRILVVVAGDYVADSFSYDLTEVLLKSTMSEERSRVTCQGHQLIAIACRTVACVRVCSSVVIPVHFVLRVIHVADCLVLRLKAQVAERAHNVIALSWRHPLSMDLPIIWLLFLFFIVSQLVLISAQLCRDLLI